MKPQNCSEQFVQTKSEHGVQVQAQDNESDKLNTARQMNVEERSTPITRVLENSTQIMDPSFQAELFQIEKQTLSADEIADMV